MEITGIKSTFHSATRAKTTGQINGLGDLRKAARVLSGHGCVNRRTSELELDSLPFRLLCPIAFNLEESALVRVAMEPLSASARERTPGAAVQYLGATPSGDRTRRRTQAPGAQSLCYRMAGPELAAPDQGAHPGLRRRSGTGSGARRGHA